MNVFLGIDGGGTGCRAVACDARGQVIGRGAAGPANIATDPDGAAANILAAARAALGDVPDGAAIAVLGLAGANVTAAARALQARLPFAEARIESDAVTAVRGALRARDGVVAALGTGSVFAAQRGGQVQVIGGWGYQLGDEASGAWLARRMLARALRAVDGFHPLTPLLQAVTQDLGGTDGVVAFARVSTPAEMAALARRVVDHPDDPAAAALLAEADAAIIEAVDLLRGGAELPVAFLGGLGDVFAARLAGRWPLIAPLGTAIDGALWMAREGV